MKKNQPILLFIFFLFWPLMGQEQMPLQTEQFVYSIDAFNGSGYSSTFCAEDSDTIYVLANNYSFIWARKSFVYFWPITRKTELETKHLFKNLDGSVIITDKSGNVQTLRLTEFAYTQNHDVYGIAWDVKIGDEAKAVIADFERLVAEFNEKNRVYQQEVELYKKFQALMIERIRVERENGMDIKHLLDELGAQTPPKAPVKSRYEVSSLKRGYMINLPEGEYKIHFNDESGRRMEGSEKRLVVFKERRKGAIGYELISADKWTKPQHIYTPSSIIYVDGSTHLYLKPFYENEYNDFYYNKMGDNQGRGNAHVYEWEFIKQVTQAKLEITQDKGDERNRDKAEALVIMEKAYYTEQIPGVSRGYKITPFDPSGAHQGREASLSAFYVPVMRDRRYIKIKLQQSSDGGEYYPLSEREIRIKPLNDYNFLLIFLIILPILIYFLVMSLRKKHFIILHERMADLEEDQ